MVPSPLSALLLFSSFLCVALTYRNDQRFLELLPRANFRLKEGTRLVVNCTSRLPDVPAKLYWSSSRENKNMISKVLDNRTVSMIIEVLHRSDAGLYICKLILPSGREYEKTVHVIITQDIKKHCSSTQFRCKEGLCIFQQFRCDNRNDCPDNSDEENCEGYLDNSPCGRHKFQCANGRCISLDLVCDKFHQNDCGDGSDEHCQMLRFPHYSSDADSISTSHPKQSSVNDQMESLKMTVYSVIGCIVGVMLFIAILLIAIFRVKMRRAAARRQMFFIERRRRDNSAAHHPYERPHERDPFLASRTRTAPPYRYSNIILNVNNGVQCVPGMEFTSIMEGPPPYSDVVSEAVPGPEAARRDSPPPPYSTVDRGPTGGCPGRSRGDNSFMSAKFNCWVASRRGRLGHSQLGNRMETCANLQNANVTATRGDRTANDEAANNGAANQRGTNNNGIVAIQEDSIADNQITTNRDGSIPADNRNAANQECSIVNAAGNNLTDNANNVTVANQEGTNNNVTAANRDSANAETAENQIDSTDIDYGSTAEETASSQVVCIANTETDTADNESAASQEEITANNMTAANEEGNTTEKKITDSENGNRTGANTVTAEYREGTERSRTNEEGANTTDSA